MRLAILRLGFCSIASVSISIVGLAVTMLSSPATAQTRDTEPQGQLEEVIVTATKRAENLYQVPISMDVFTADDITRYRIVSIDDFAALVPGLTYIPLGSNEAYLSLRGIQQADDSSGEDQPVTLFIDDISSASISDAQPSDLYDIDRVEVLKGPQGTLFGRNAVGGVVSIFTRNPTFKTEGTSEVTYGEDNLFEVKGMYNTPIIDNELAGRLVLTSHNRDGNVYDETTHNYIFEENRYTARGKLLFTPTEAVTNLFQFDALHDVSTPDASIWFQGNFRPSLFPEIAYGPQVTTEGFHGSSKRSIWGLADRLDVETGIGTLTSITGYRHVSTSVTVDDFDDPTNMWIPTIASRDSQFTEEMRLTSKPDQRLKWVGGVYFLHAIKRRPITIDVNLVPGTAFYNFPTVPQYTGFIRQNTTINSPAVFGEATYSILPKLAFTLGARYTQDQKSGSSYINPETLLSGPPISATYSNTWSAFTPRTTLTFQASDALMTYATVSKGYQSGGYNVNASTEAGLQTPFNPEYVWNYEVGTKFDGLDHRLQTSLTGFIDKYTDMQIIEFDERTNTTITKNAATATAKGVELDIRGAPARWLTLGLGYSYLDGRFTNYVVNNGPGAPLAVYTGNKLPYQPTNSLTVRAEVHFDAPQLRGHISIGGDATWRSTMEFDSANDTPEFARQFTEVHGLVNVHANWMSEDGRWTVSLWDKNLRKIWYASSGFDDTAFLASVAEFSNPSNHIFSFEPNPPPSFGVTISAKLE
jgi:iron complex outermembrane receptor protein